MSKKPIKTAEPTLTTEQRIQRLKLEQTRARKEKENLDKRRRYLIGAFVERMFPDVLRYNPQVTTAQAEIEFKPLIRFLSALSADKKLVERLRVESNV